MERVPSVNINSATWVASLVSYFHRSGVIYPRLAGFSIWSVGSLPNCIYLLKTISNLSTVYRGDRGSPYRIFESLHSEHPFPTHPQIIPLNADFLHFRAAAIWRPPRAVFAFSKETLVSVSCLIPTVSLHCVAV